MDYPNAQNLTDFLAGQGITTSQDLTVYVLGAIQRWEEQTGFLPFLNENGADTVWRYDPPQSDRKLDFEGGFISITEIRKNVTNTYAGDVLTEGQDYELLPFNAVNDGKPFEFAKFYVSQRTPFPYGLLNAFTKTLQVTGKRGYTTSLKPDAYRAILEEAAADALFALMPGFGILAGIKQGPISMEYQHLVRGATPGQYATKTEAWHAGFVEAVYRYGRTAL